METRNVLKDEANMPRVCCLLKASSEFLLQLNGLNKLKKKKGFIVLMVGYNAELVMVYNGPGKQ